jgi:hypothetical protein
MFIALILFGAIIFGLLMIVLQASAGLSEAKEDLGKLQTQVGELQEDRADEMRALIATVNVLTRDLASTQEKAVDALTSYEQAAGGERHRLASELDALKIVVDELEAAENLIIIEDDDVAPPDPFPSLLPPRPDPEPVSVVPPPLPEVEEAAPEEKPEYVEYTIKRGDTVSEIALKYKVKTAELLEFNGIADPRKIGIGQVLKIPGK